MTAFIFFCITILTWLLVGLVTWVIAVWRKGELTWKDICLLPMALLGPILLFAYLSTVLKDHVFWRRKP